MSGEGGLGGSIAELRSAGKAPIGRLAKSLCDFMEPPYFPSAQTEKNYLWFSFLIFCSVSILLFLDAILSCPSDMKSPVRSKR